MTTLSTHARKRFVQLGDLGGRGRLGARASDSWQNPNFLTSVSKRFACSSPLFKRGAIVLESSCGQ